MKALLSAVFAVVVVVSVGCAHKPAQAPAATVEAAPVASKPVIVQTTNADEQLAKLLQGAVVHFDFDQSRLQESGEKNLQKVAEALKSRPGVSVRIAGHCDERGTEEYNLALGQRRAEVARKYLIALGIDGSRIDTVSFGEEKPAQQGANEASWAANRRDELELKK